jgi:glycosyltransferase involved in cell wall biosynthesis
MEPEQQSAPKIRVLRIIARLNIGGPAIHTILLSRHMERLGYETVLVAGKVGSEEGDMAYLAEAEGVKPIIVETLGKNLRPAADLQAFLCILRLLFTFRPHILDTHTAKAGTLGRSAGFFYNSVQGLKSRIRCGYPENRRQIMVNPDSRALRPKCKMVHTFHGHALWGYFSPFKSRIFQIIERLLARITDAIVVVSEGLKGELFKKYGVGRPERYRVIPLGLELTSLFESANRKGQFRSNLGLPDNATKLVGIIGRLTPIKNHHLFLKAVAVLVSNGPERETRFVVVGDGELRQDLEDVTQQLGLTKLVGFTGWLKDLVPVYADLDILALSSISEGTPVTVIEAMAAGVPVVATDVGGVRELISEGRRRNSEPQEGTFEVCERGVLVHRGDVVGFARGLNHLLENPGLCKEMGRRGKEYARSRHSKDRLIADMDRLYRSLL